MKLSSIVFISAGCASAVNIRQRIPKFDELDEPGVTGRLHATVDAISKQREKASQPVTRKQGFEHECFKTVPISLAQHAFFLQQSEGKKNPGAGIKAGKPFGQIYKDGFSYTGCIKDKLFYEGDKFGDNRHSYTMGASHNVSIVHYADMVPKEDRKPMTHTVCFDFCRTMESMSAFGLLNGRECYCVPFFEQIAGDSSECTAPCDGEVQSFCGGKTKSMIFEMHSCKDGPVRLGVAAVHAHNEQELLLDLIPKAKSAANGKQKLAQKLQEVLGKNGNPEAAALMQVAKVSAGELLHAAEAGERAMEALQAPLKVAVKLTGLPPANLGSVRSDLEHGGAPTEESGSAAGNLDSAIAQALGNLPEGTTSDFNDFDVAKEGDDTTKLLEKLTDEASEKFLALQKLYIKNEPEINNVFNVLSGSCVVDDEGCVMSASQKSGAATYLNHEDCEIELPVGGADVKLEYFQTEPWYDYIEVNGKQYTSQYTGDWSYPDGTALDSAKGRYCAYTATGYNYFGDACEESGAGLLKDQTHVSGVIRWKTDYSVLAGGFKMCAEQNVDTKDNAIQYYPLMYFVDKEHVNTPTTCTGTTVGQPIYFKSVHSCAAACDAAVGECVGFSFYPDKSLENNNGPNICFLFSKFESARYYTGCKSEEKKASFLQKHNSTFDNPSDIVSNPEWPVCALKLSKFVGTSIKPDPSGKCKGCLKELKQADRCYNN